MQVSTVASESAFSAGGRVVDPFRGRLEPETVEALICTKNWIGASKGNLLNFISTSCAPCDIIILIIIIINHSGSDIASVVKDMDMPSLEERFTTLVHMVCILSIF